MQPNNNFWQNLIITLKKSKKKVYLYSRAIKNLKKHEIKKTNIPTVR